MQPCGWHMEFRMHCPRNGYLEATVEPVWRGQYDFENTIVICSILWMASNQYDYHIYCLTSLLQYITTSVLAHVC